MSKRKTEEEIDAEVAALVTLKPTVRKHTAFGDDNHAAIDAQIAVLRERMGSDEVYDAYEDDSDEAGRHALDAALGAYDWMTGALASDEAPAAGWAGAEA